MEDDGYRSKIFYEVTGGGESYHGWEPMHIGCGSMRFVKGEYEIHVSAPMTDEIGKGGWMNKCWDQFRKKVREYELAETK